LDGNATTLDSAGTGCWDGNSYMSGGPSINQNGTGWEENGFYNLANGIYTPTTFYPLSSSG